MNEEPGLQHQRSRWPAVAIVAALVLAAAGFGVRHYFSEPEETEAPAAQAPDSAKPETKPEAEAAKPGTPDAAASSVASETVMVDARPAAVLKGQGKWDDSAKTLSEAIKKLSAAVAKAGLSVNGRPITVFTKTDDTGFSFEAMVPLGAAPEGKPKLSDGVEIGASPSGKALKFQHRGAYDEIDATYEAIAAYLDEKGLDSKDLIIEEYLSDFKGDEAEVNVDIYVFLK